MQPIARVEPAATQRFDSIDVLRGLSIIAVVLLHSYLRFHFSDHSIRPLLPSWIFRLLFLNGNNGVTVFFAISGFLITYTSLRRFGSLRKLSARVFYRIRFARIAPLLLAVLAVLSVLHLVHADGFRIHTKGVTLPRALLSAVTFHLNWLEARYGYLPANWDVMWSLSIEEMFYLFFPPVCLLLLRARRGTAVLVALLMAFAFAGPVIDQRWTALNDIWAEKSYLGGMSAIALGCLCALLVRWLQQQRKITDRTALWLAWAGAACLVFTLWPAAIPMRRWMWDHHIGDTMLPVATCLVMLGTTLRNRRGSRWTAALRWFGRHSYEVYLTHEFVVVWITLLALRVGTHHGLGLGRGLFAWITLILLLSAVLGWMVARFFSEPMNRRLRGARPPATAAGVIE